MIRCITMNLEYPIKIVVLFFEIRYFALDWAQKSSISDCIESIGRNEFQSIIF